MKLAVFSFFILISIFGQAQLNAVSRAGSSQKPTAHTSDLRLNIFLPGVQMRYQDTAAQSQEIVTHYTYTLSFQAKKFLLGFEYLTQSENSGNPSFEIEKNFNEQNLFFGYTAVKKDFFVSGKFLLEFMLTPEVLMGRSANLVKTRLMGTSIESNSTAETTYGMGLIGSARTGYLLVETDLRYQTSKNYEPGSLMLGTVRIGANFQF